MSSQAQRPSGVEGDVLDKGPAGPKAIRGSALRVAGYAVGTLLSLAAIPFLIRHLGVAKFGQYSTVIALIALVGGVSDAGLTSIAIREHATRAGPDRDQLFRDLIGIRIVLAVVGVAAATAFALLAGYDSALVVGTVLAGVGLMADILQTTYASALQAELKLGWVTATDVLRRFVQAVLIVALVVAGAGLTAFLAVPIGAGLAALLLTVAVVRGSVALTPSFHLARWRGVLRETLPVSVAVMLHQLYFRIAIILMSITTVAVETGYFATSFRVIEALLVIPLLLVTGVLPVMSRAARDDEERLAYTLQRTAEITGIGGILIAGSVFFSAGFAIPLLGGADADPAIAVLQIQAFALAFNFLASTWGHGLFALREHRSLVISSALALVVTSTLTVVLASNYEARGAAVATVIGEALLAITYLVLLVRARSALRPSPRLVPRVLLAAVVAVAPCVAIHIHPMAEAAIFAAVYVAALRALRAVPEEVEDALGGVVGAALNRRAEPRASRLRPGGRKSG